MAVDTENKRRSVQAYTFGLLRPVADGAVSAADRSTVGWLYSGFLTADTGGRRVTGRVVSPLHGGILLTKRGSAA